MREGVEWIFSGISSRLPLFAPGRAAHIKDTPQTGQIFPFFSENPKKTPRGRRDGGNGQRAHTRPSEPERNTEAAPHSSPKGLALHRAA